MKSPTTIAAPAVAPPRPAAGVPVRSDLRAGGYYGCQAYCAQEFRRCSVDPNMSETVCNDRLPVCQNACDVCALTP